MRKHRSVTEPHASLQYQGNTFQYQQELDNFTKSVIELEAVICHTSENPNPEILHEKSATHTLYLPQGADRFELRQCHANLKQFRDLESCTDELVTKRQQVFQSPLKQSTSIVGDVDGNGPKQGINGGPLFRDESESHILGGIHLSRVYFSQHSINGKQTLQEAQSGDVQIMNETSRKSENKTRSKRRNVQFDERDAKRLLPMEAKKHPSHPNPSTNKRSIKGLFQKTSTQSKKLHRHRMFSDKYVYFFSESEHSSLNTDKEHCSQFKQHNSGFSGKQQDASTSSPSAQQRKTFETSFEKEEENDSSEMQVVVDNDGRVLVNVLHGKQKTNQQPPSNTHQIDLQRPKEGYVNKHEHDMYDKHPLRQESSLPAGQTRHIYAKMKLDSSFSALHDATHFQDMNNEQTLLYPRGYGNRVLVVRNDEKPSGNDPAFPHNIPRYVQRDCEYGHHDHEGRYQPKTLPTSHDNHFRERQPARSVFNTVAKRSSFINYQVNTEQKSRNDGIGDTSCQIHNPMGDRRATSFSQTNPDHSFTSHQKATPKTIPESQETSQPNLNTSEVEINVNNSQSRKDLTEDKSNAHLSNSNEQRYRCDWPACTKAFRHYSFLVLHRRIHTGERPYNCSWEGCNKQFRRSDDYQRHYRVHTGVKPYPCIICGKAFKRSDHRLFHYRAIHNMYKQ